MAKWSRRNFITTFTSGFFGMGLTKTMRADSTKLNNRVETEDIKIKKYNILGKTGLKVSDVSCGAISFFEPNVMRYAFDLGVNYFDTAEGYMNTNSERYIGQALSGIRDKVIITTKHGYSSRTKITRQNIINRMENSLKRMKTDYVDIALVHGINDLKLLYNEELLSAYSQLKKDGKIRFTGFSTHNAPVTLKQALDSDFTQVVLVVYSHMQSEIEPLLEQVKKKGIGVIAMKIFAGGKHGNLKSFIGRETSYPQAAIRWVLSNPNIDTCITTMSSYSHVEEYVAASGLSLDRADMNVLVKYQHLVDDQYCRVGCEECLNACPNNVPINDVLRYSMYFEDYKMEKEAIRYYAEIDDQIKPYSCVSCNGVCSDACPYGLKVRENLIRANEILSA